MKAEPAASGQVALREALEAVERAADRSVKLFEHGSLVVKMYAPRGKDDQSPHTRDEIYVVAQGSGEFVCGASRRKFGPGEVIFASAGVAHHFENFSSDFCVWVMFYGPVGGENAAKQG